MSENNKNEWISAKEAAKMLGMHHSTLYILIQKNEEIKNKKAEELTEGEKKFKCPPYIRIGIKNKFTRESIEQFIEESKTNSASQS